MPASCISFVPDRAHSSFCSRRMAPIKSRVRRSFVAFQMPDRLSGAGRLTSAWSRSIGVCGVQFLAVLLDRKSCPGEDVVHLASSSENGDQLGHLGPELVGDLTATGIFAAPRRPPGRYGGAPTLPALDEPAWASRLRAKCTRHLCQVIRPRIRVAWRPSDPCWSSEISPASRHAARAGPAEAQERRSQKACGAQTRRSGRCPGPRRRPLVVDGAQPRVTATEIDALLKASRICSHRVASSLLDRASFALDSDLIEEAVDLIVDLAAQPGDLASCRDARHRPWPARRSSTERVRQAGPGCRPPGSPSASAFSDHPCAAPGSLGT